MEGVEEIDGFLLAVVEGCLVGPRSGHTVCEFESNERKRKRKLSDSDGIGSGETGGGGGKKPKRVQTWSSDHSGDGSVVEDNFQFQLVSVDGPLIDNFDDHSLCLGEPDCGPNPASTTGNSEEEPSMMMMLDLLDQFLDVHDGAHWGSAVDQDHSPLTPSVSDAHHVMINGGASSAEETLILNVLDDILADEGWLRC